MGVSGESVGSIQNEGAVNVLYGTASGLSASGNQLWDQNSPGVRETAEPYDFFGGELG